MPAVELPAIDLAGVEAPAVGASSGIRNENRMRTRGAESNGIGPNELEPEGSLTCRPPC